jgi:hypothetical protein
MRLTPRPQKHPGMADKQHGHAEVETAMRFPLPHTPDGGNLKSGIAALD